MARRTGLPTNSWEFPDSWIKNNDADKLAVLNPQLSSKETLESSEEVGLSDFHPMTHEPSGLIEF